MADRFGTSDDVDAFLIAMLIPAILSLALGNSFRDALIPVYAERRLKDKVGADRIVSNIIWICFAVLIAMSLLMFWLSQPIIGMAAKGFSPEKLQLSEYLFHIVAPYTICVGASGILKGFLQAHSRFALSGIAPVLIPATIMVILLTFPGEPTATWLAWGTSGGSILMVVVLFIDCYRIHAGNLMQLPVRDRDTLTVVKSTPALLAGTIVIESYLFVDTMMVASLPPGSVAVLSFGERICGVFCIAGAAVAQAMFPQISDLVAQRSWVQLKATIHSACKWTLACSAPLVAVFWAFPEPIVGLIFERGEFTAEDTRKVGDVITFAVLQIPGSILLALAAKMVMALRANHVVLIYALLGLGVNVGLNILFIDWFGVKGVALSTAMVHVFSATILFVYAGLRLKKTGEEEASENAGD